LGVDSAANVAGAIATGGLATTGVDVAPETGTLSVPRTPIANAPSAAAAATEKTESVFAFRRRRATERRSRTRDVRVGTELDARSLSKVCSREGEVDTGSFDSHTDAI